MGSAKPQPVKAPYEQQQQQQQTNTYGSYSIADTPEARAFLDAPIDIDPGVGRRTDLAEQAAEHRYNANYSPGISPEYRMSLLDAEKRNIRGQGAYEAQQANYQKNALQLGRLERLLPQILQTGGASTGSTSGFNTQVVQPQPGFW